MFVHCYVVISCNQFWYVYDIAAMLFAPAFFLRFVVTIVVTTNYTYYNAAYQMDRYQS